MAPLQRHLGGGFVSVASLAIWGIGLVIFIRQPLITLVTDVVLRSEATGFMGITPNKVCGRLYAGLESRDCVPCLAVDHVDYAGRAVL